MASVLVMEEFPDFSDDDIHWSLFLSIWGDIGFFAAGGFL